jgi:hypothetical protein
MPSMRAVLEARRKAAIVRVKELEAELERVRAGLADAEEVLRRRVIGFEQYLEASAVVAVGLSRMKPVGLRRAVPHRENAAGVEDLSVDYQAVMAAAVEAGVEGLGARRTAVVLGWDSASVSRVEGARARLKRLVERGWLVETKPGRFTTPPSAQTRASRRKRPVAAGRRVRAASRSVVDAGVTSTDRRSPSVSVSRCRLRPLIFFPASNPLEVWATVASAFTDCESTTAALGSGSRPSTRRTAWRRRSWSSPTSPESRQRVKKA